MVFVTFVHFACHRSPRHRLRLRRKTCPQKILLAVRLNTRKKGTPCVCERPIRTREPVSAPLPRSLLPRASRSFGANRDEACCNPQSTELGLNTNARRESSSRIWRRARDTRGHKYRRAFLRDFNPLRFSVETHLGCGTRPPRYTAVQSSEPQTL